MPRSENSRRIPIRADSLIHEWAGELDLDAARTRMAAALGIGASTLRAYLGTRTLPPDVIAPIAEALGPELGAELLQAVCGDAFDVVPAVLPEGRVAGSVVWACSRTVKECAETIAAIADATGDGRVSPAEAQRILKETREAVMFLHLMARQLREEAAR